jgi:hypothetical protein
MFGIVLMALGTGLSEASSSLGKMQVAKKRESIYSMAFLSSFFTVVFIGVTVTFGASFTFNFQSLPSFLVRVCLEILLAYITTQAIVKADRSTFGFLRLITLPLLLIVDIVLHYTFSISQIAGMVIIILSLGLLLGFRTTSRKGTGLIIISSTIAVITISLYKYDITHFNSVAAEQMIVGTVLVLFFGVLAKYKNNENVWRFFSQPVLAFQSLSMGLGGVCESFAYTFAPASVIVAAKRGLEVLWSILAGHYYFKEFGLKVKITVLIMVIIALILLAGIQP